LNYTVIQGKISKYNVFPLNPYEKYIMRVTWLQYVLRMEFSRSAVSPCTELTCYLPDTVLAAKDKGEEDGSYL
jgi:hypothetical protein